MMEHAFPLSRSDRPSARARRRTPLPVADEYDDRLPSAPA